MNLIKTLKSSRGFTIVETVLFMTLSAIIMALTSQIMISQLTTYSTIGQQETDVTNVRHALNRIASELIHLETSDILAVDSHKIDFIDANGNATYYLIADRAILRGADEVYNNADILNFMYYDAANNPTLVPADVRQINITISTVDQGAGDLTLMKRVFPRGFIYANYQ